MTEYCESEDFARFGSCRFAGGHGVNLLDRCPFVKCLDRLQGSFQHKDAALGVSKGRCMSETLLSGVEYHDDDWPHGLACSQCRRVFSEPERYSEQLDAVTDDALLTRIVCLGCAGLLERC